MRTLILVDLDNVLRPELPKGQRPSAWYLPTNGGEGLEVWASSPATATFVRREAPPLPDGGAVVVIAFNEHTASLRGREPLRSVYLLNLASRLATLVSVSGDVRVEPILARTIPQAVDFALLTALLRASDASSSGPFEAVTLMSGDTGLRNAVTARLGGSPDPPTRTRFLTRCNWRLVTQHKRTSPSLPSPRSASMRVPSGWSAEVSTNEHVAAVEDRTLEWFPTGEFTSFAARTMQRIEHLTMLGLTVHTSRGVARLGDLLCSPSKPIRLGPLNPTDGVEWPTSGPLRNVQVRDPVRASIGDGAVRFPSIEATLPTRLPLPVIKRAAETSRLEAGQPFSDLAVLQCFRRALVDVGHVVLKVRCERRTVNHGDMIRFTVEAATECLPGWWFDHDGGLARATSELETGAPIGLAIPTDSFDAELVVDDRLSEPRVDLAAPNVGELTVTRRTDGWELAVAAPDHRSALVLLPPRAMLSSHERYAVRRIQEIGYPPDGWGFDEGLWHFLKRVPLLVPCQWACPSAVLPARGAT